jgi:glycosyltransferase involved in cell wall biosynthesis
LNKSDFVSIIVPVFNGVNTIEALLNALGEQSYPRESFEILIVDNASTDETTSLIKALARRNPTLTLRLLSESQRRGSYAARNRGVAAAQGSILAFTDADCQPTPGWITAGVEALRDSGVEQVAGAIEFMAANDPPNIWEHLDSVLNLRQASYASQGWAATANLFVQADALAKVKGFRADLQSGGDSEFGQRMKAAGFRIAYCPKALVRHLARSSYMELVSKARRIATGVEVLAREGVCYEPLSLRALRPRRRIPGYSLANEPRLFRWAITLLLFNYFHYLGFGTRLAMRLRQPPGLVGRKLQATGGVPLTSVPTGIFKRLPPLE